MELARIVALLAPAPVLLLALWHLRGGQSGASSLAARGAEATDQPRARLSCGEVEGAWEYNGTVAAFRGVPYGAPPTGPRRWQPPAPAECWAPGRVLGAVADGPSCYQGGEGGHESEDCLNLNVFAPSQSLSRQGGPTLPVLVWIFGGCNTEGSVATYGPIEKIVMGGDLILVAMNYRLGVFGWLALAELSAADPRGVSGNYAILDQQLALRWVQENVHAFGGDASRVTIAGQSSGGTNVLALLASVGSRGLFHRAISLSGSPNLTMDQATKEAQDRELILERTRCATATDVRGCLLGLTTQELYSAMPDSYSYFHALYDYPTDNLGIGARVKALVHVDGATISYPLQEAYRMGINDVPLLLQSLQAEMDCAPVTSLENASVEEVREWFGETFSPAYGATTAAEIYQRYVEYTDPHPAYAVYALDSDTGAACGLRALALAAREGFTSPVYWATVTGAPSSAIPGWGRFPFHTLDVVAATGTWQELDYQPSASDERFGAMILGHWVGLARDGRLPGADWRPVQLAPKGRTWGSRVEKSQTTLVYDPKAEVCGFWQSIGVGQEWWWIN